MTPSLNKDGKRPKSAYISDAISSYCLNGDAYLTEEKLLELCRHKKKDLGYEVFRLDLEEQIKKGAVHREADRIYSKKTWRYEEQAAERLSELMRLPPLPLHPRKAVAADGMLFDEAQCAALSMALSNRLSLILGGAGSGKTTLIRALVREANAGGETVLCAPTGKAARNLTERTGLTARTVHSALGKIPDEDFLDAVRWNHTELVIVDECSMMTIEMLAGILNRVHDTCKVVLIGDFNQLPSVGAGNVIDDLLKLRFPCARLSANYRLNQLYCGLAENVTRFGGLSRANELIFDDSIVLEEKPEAEALEALVARAAKGYLSGESIQILSPFRTSTTFSVANLNMLIREKVNQSCPGQKSMANHAETLRDGDRVMITENDRERSCVNGDVGVLRIESDDDNGLCFSVEMADGRISRWDAYSSCDGKRKLTLAYALTVHKSQGSQYDTVLMPLTMEMQTMLNRNLFYTAISRARCKVVLYGNRQAVEVCMQRALPKRKSALVPKTNTRLLQMAV